MGQLTKVSPDDDVGIGLLDQPQKRLTSARIGVAPTRFIQDWMGEMLPRRKKTQIDE